MQKQKIQHSRAHTFDTIYIHYPLLTDGFNERKEEEGGGEGGIEVPQQIFASAFIPSAQSNNLLNAQQQQQ